jgi:hypothetical protein
MFSRETFGLAPAPILRQPAGDKTLRVRASRSAAARCAAGWGYDFLCHDALYHDLCCAAIVLVE